MTHKIKHTSFIILATALILTGCNTIQNAYNSAVKSANIANGQEEAFITHNQCPTVQIMEDLATHRSAEDSTITLTAENAHCTFDSNKTAIATMTLNFAATGQNETTPYFVAITDPAGKIMTKETFSYTPGTTRKTIRQIIPIKSRATAKNYSVLAGFQLTDQQLTQNRLALELQHAKAKTELLAIDEILENAAAEAKTKQDTPIKIAP